MLNEEWYEKAMKPVMAKWMMLWLEAEGVQMEQVYLVPQGAGDEGRLALVTAKDVRAGATLFEIPDRLLLTAGHVLEHQPVLLPEKINTPIFWHPHAHHVLKTLARLFRERTG